MSVEVSLTWGEVYLAGSVGLMRIVSNLQHKRKDRNRLVHSDLGADMEWRGAIGELAVSKYLDRFWSGSIGAIRAADVGGRVQVRACGREDHCLLLHDDDSDAQPFVCALVTRAALPRVTLRGWMYGVNGKRPEFWRDPTGAGRPAFFVPTDHLTAMEYLTAMEPRAR